LGPSELRSRDDRAPAPAAALLGHRRLQRAARDEQRELLCVPLSPRAHPRIETTETVIVTGDSSRLTTNTACQSTVDDSWWEGSAASRAQTDSRSPSALVHPSETHRGAGNSNERTAKTK